MSRVEPGRNTHGLLQWARGMCTDELPHTEIDALLRRAVEAVKDIEAERDHYIRLFNRLEKAVSRHREVFEHAGYPWDEELYAAHDRVMRDAAKGPHWRPEKRERPEAA